MWNRTDCTKLMPLHCNTNTTRLLVWRWQTLLLKKFKIKYRDGQRPSTRLQSAVLTLPSTNYYYCTHCPPMTLFLTCPLHVTKPHCTSLFGLNYLISTRILYFWLKILDFIVKFSNLHFDFWFCIGSKFVHNTAMFLVVCSLLVGNKPVIIIKL